MVVCSADGRLCFSRSDGDRIEVRVVPGVDVGLACQAADLAALRSGFSLQLVGSDGAWLRMHEVDGCVLYKGQTATGERFAGKLNPEELDSMLDRLARQVS